MAVGDVASARLAEIAARFGCPVETFLAAPDGVLDLLETEELLTLWSTIRQSQVRQRILDFVRCQAGGRMSAPEAAE
ncbi:hypothetical protein MKK88_20645 [Methylobacterium sp. E-005]|uniref:hypothetical protein n=1 Tax=Methylobacterium sp. E-005 TaxID=2836549 RepID=UPI001FB9B2FE|nr:hypothetical protein [Methylobacterium sp. E-005]MCJ2088376.1 hypothetical protein [Methylobacterium sp. E-005]